MSTNVSKLSTKRCISPGQARLLRQKIVAYSQAVTANSWAGVVDPNDYDTLRLAELEAELDLDRYIKKLQGGTTA